MQLTLLLWWYIYGGVAEVLQKNSSTLDYNKFKHLLFYYFLMCKKKKKKRSSYSKTNFCPSLRLIMYLSYWGRGTFTSSLPNKSQNNRDSLMNMSYMALLRAFLLKVPTVHYIEIIGNWLMNISTFLSKTSHQIFP